MSRPPDLPWSFAVEIILYVRDLEEARGFYNFLLGLEIVYESDWFISFKLSEDAFLCLNGRREDYEKHGTAGRGVLIEVGKKTEAEVDGVFQRLQGMGIPVEMAPEAKPWGLYSGGVRDPEGYRVWFSAPIPGRTIA